LRCYQTGCPGGCGSWWALDFSGRGYRFGKACAAKVRVMLPRWSKPRGCIHQASVAVVALVLVIDRAVDDQFIRTGALQQVRHLLGDGLLVTDQGAGQGREYLMALMGLPERVHILYRRP